MPDFFNFSADNDYVRQRLTQNEITAVRTWQNQRLDYQFSFHTQHEAGWPCYLSEPDGPGRNLPKINLKVPGTMPLLQGESVRNNAIGADFAAVIRANIALFQKMAEPYYEGVQVVVNVLPPEWVVVYSCKLVATAKTVGVKLQDAYQSPLATTFWPNFKGRAHKPNCFVHKSPNCMEGVLHHLAGKEAAKVTKVYEDSGAIIG